jgi:subtilisin family serine protease
MRSPNEGFRSIGLLSASAAIALLALASVATAAQAQMKAGGMSAGPRGPMMGSGPNIRGSESRVQGGMRDHDAGGRPGGRRPGMGTLIGTGVLIGTIGSAIANQPPPPPPRSVSQSPGSPPSRGNINIPPSNEQRFVKDEVVLEFAGNFPPAGIAQLLARHRLTELEAQPFTLTNSTFVRARIANRTDVRAVLRGLGREVTLRTGQPNYLYRNTQAATFAPPADAAPAATPVVAAAGARPAAGDPAQYALTKLRLNEAHNHATGDKVLVAVIDSGVDLSHPELQGVVAGSFDALGKNEKAHSHGTAIAGAIAARAKLLGAAPSARILAIRAFGTSGASAEATTFAVLKSIEYAVSQNARVINMSFAGPNDPGLARHLAAAKVKGAVLVAATGNFGPKSPPQYPAADPNVIAVSATDADDKMFKASNIGPHVAVTAPGVDILLPAPDNNYQVTSGTSFSAAYVSGVAALMLQRAPGLTPDAVRKILISTAKDLGPRGKDAEYGAGLVDAYQAIMAVPPGAVSGAPNAPQPPVTAR